MSAAAVPRTAVSSPPRVLRSAQAAARFAAVGAATTALYWALFLLAQPALGATWAALVALVASTLVNTAAQRRYTFCSTADPRTASRDHIASLAAFGGSWLLSVWALGILASLAPAAPALAELAVAQACTLTGSAARFLLLFSWHRH